MSEKGGLEITVKDKDGKVKDYFKRTRIKGKGIISKKGLKAYQERGEKDEGSETKKVEDKS